MCALDRQPPGVADGYPGAEPGVCAGKTTRLPAGMPGTLARVRVLIVHGYLLRGTGSNDYNAALAEAFA